jgi:hypothetical protein
MNCLGTFHEDWHHRQHQFARPEECKMVEQSRSFGQMIHTRRLQFGLTQ